MSTASQCSPAAKVADDPFVRFRASMTEHPSVAAASRHSSAEGADDNEDGTQELLKLIDEATHAFVADEPPGAGASFTVIGSANQSFSHLSGPPPGGLLGQSLFNASTSSVPLPPPPPVSPPSFAQTMAASANHNGNSGSAHKTSPIPSTAALPAPPPPPSSHGESMLVRNHKGVFLLQPISRHVTSTGVQPPPPAYHGSTPPPAYGSATSAQPSPPVSPLPSYSLPPALPPAAMLSNTSLYSSAHSGTMGHVAVLPSLSGVTAGTSSTNTPILGASTVPMGGLVGGSPASLAAPPPYRHAPSSGPVKFGPY